MNENKVIHASVWAPDKAIFKDMRNDKATCTTITCNNSENCGLYSRNECSWLAILGWQACPYGSILKEEGYTKRAKSYRNWVDKRREKYSSVLDNLSAHKNVIAIVGDYIFLPYAHITMNEAVPFRAKGGVFRKENCFLPTEAFTIDNIISICEFRPHALMGGEITQYQEKEVPQLIKHLSEQMPEVFTKLCKKYDKARIIENNYSNIGRKALLSTITPNAGMLVDIHKGTWIWNGEYLTSENSHASFMLIDTFSELRIKPTAEAVVEIIDESQVNRSTQFLS